MVLTSCDLFSSHWVELDKEQEGVLSKKLMALDVNEAGSSAISEDSFSSCPDSAHNKGAVEFLALVEKALQKADSKQSILGFDT